MSNVIHKYRLTPFEKTKVDTTNEVIQVLNVGLDGVGNICIWTLEDENKPSVHFDAHVIPTGVKFTDDLPSDYRGTVLTRTGLIFHVFVGAIRS